MTVIPRLPEFFARYPHIHLRLGASDRFADLVGEGVDVAIRVGPLRDSSLVARRLGLMEQVNVAAPSYLAQFGVPQTPYVPGGQGVGTVESSDTFEPGARVWFFTTAGMKPGLPEPRTCSATNGPGRRSGRWATMPKIIRRAPGRRASASEREASQPL